MAINAIISTAAIEVSVYQTPIQATINMPVIEHLIQDSTVNATLLSTPTNVIISQSSLMATLSTSSIDTIIGPGISDHGQLSGLSDDDHPHYHTDSRGDARYYQQPQVDALIAAIPAPTPAGADTQLQYNNGGVFGGASALTYDNVNNFLGIGEAIPESPLHMAEATSGSIDQILRDTFGSDDGNWSFTSGGDWEISSGRLRRTAATISSDEAELSLSYFESEFLSDQGRAVAAGDVFVMRLSIYTTTAGTLQLKFGNNSSTTYPFAATQVGSFTSQYFHFEFTFTDVPPTIVASDGWIGSIDNFYVYLRKKAATQGMKQGDADIVVNSGRNVIMGENCNPFLESSGNVSVGDSCLPVLLGGRDNIAIGSGSLQVNLESDSNIAIGDSTLRFYVGRNGSDGGNTAMGELALQALVWGSSNLGLGERGGSSLTYGEENIFIGRSSGIGMAIGDENIAIGKSAALVDGDYQLNIGNLITGDMTAADKQLVISGGTAQSQDVTQWQDSSGTALATISATGGADFADYSVGGAAGASGSFTTVDGKTVTVTNGLIIGIV